MRIRYAAVLGGLVAGLSIVAPPAMAATPDKPTTAVTSTSPAPHVTTYNTGHCGTPFVRDRKSVV